MAECSIIEGLGCPTCEDLDAKAGLSKNLYIGSLSDLDEDNPFTFDIDGRVESINLGYQKYLYKFCAMDRTAGTNQEIITGDNRIKLWQQTITGMFQQQSQAAKNVIDALKKVRDLFVVVETNYSTFEVFFITTGGEITAATKASGLIATDSNLWNLTIAQVDNGELNAAPDFFDTSYQQTKALLESYTE
jgi:hypothetical protein